jgi:hypothetical protein
MSQDSNELFLKIESNKSNENPYANVNSQSKSHKKHHKRKKKHKLNLNYEDYEAYGNSQPHSHLLQLLSIFLICLFYTIVLKTKSNFLYNKYYHSLCLGLISLVDFLINRTQFNFVLEENDQTEKATQTLLDKPSSDFSDKDKNLTMKSFLSISFILSGVSFISELLVFYYLKNIRQEFRYNAGIGFSLLSIEFILIRMFYSYYYVKLDFINFLGLITLLVLTTTIALAFLNITILSLSVFISSLRFIKFYIFYEISNYKYVNVFRLILTSNVFDFIIGGVFAIVFLIKEESVFDSFRIFDFSMIILATICYYLNLKYFRDYDRYGISIASMVFPVLIIFDIFINNSRIELIQFVLVSIVSLGVTISYLGDKFVKGEECHHYGYHSGHQSRQDSGQQSGNYSGHQSESQEKPNLL